jgi:hypothetical protein
MRRAWGSHTNFLPGKETHGQDRLFRLFRPPRAVSSRFNLQQRQARVIKENSPGGGERHATCLALQQLHTDFGFQVANLPAQRRLRRVQSPLSGRQ